MRTTVSRRTFVGLLSAVPLALAVPVAASSRRDTDDPLGEANRLFEAGLFAAADAAYRAALAGDPRNVRALTRHGELLLLSNRLDAAAAVLERARSLAPGDSTVLRLLAVTYYRSDDFAAAAPLYEKLGENGLAELLRAFAGRRPYQVDGPHRTVLSFPGTGAVPVVDVSVNGLAAQPFVLDTGAEKLVVGSGLATQARVPKFGTSGGLCGGGLSTSMALGRIDRVGLGDVSVQNVPAAISEQPGMRLPDGRTTAGVLGTAVLRHFPTTIDYARGALLLGATAARESVPFWMAGDHFMVSQGTINEHGPLQFLIDTGGPVGFSASPQTVLDAGIHLDPDLGHPATGCGGTVTVIPFTADSVGLGGLSRQRVPGESGFFTQEMANAHGFRVGGVVGSGFLRGYAVSFDFATMRLSVR
jgi:gag-polyprotein putative aspartyl protease/Tetratricopeptide repeat/Aspartyl protease